MNALEHSGAHMYAFPLAMKLGAYRWAGLGLWACNLSSLSGPHAHKDAAIGLRLRCYCPEILNHLISKLGFCNCSLLQ